MRLARVLEKSLPPAFRNRGMNVSVMDWRLPELPDS